MNELTKRIFVAILGIPLVLGAIISGGYLYLIFIATVSTLAIYEFYKMAEAKKYFPSKFIGITTNLLLYFIVGIFYSHKYIFLYSEFLLYSIYLLLLLSAAAPIQFLLSKNNNIFASLGVTLSGIMYISVPMILLVYLRFEDSFSVINNNMYLILLLFTGVWICDTAAYFVGKSIGKRKLLERVSPKKTIAGAVAGLISSAIYVPLVSMIVLPNTPFYISVSLGIIIGIFGQIGDLIESKFKRDAGVKDSGNIFPGHGGVLDRFDSIIFITPFVFLLLILF